MTFKKWQKPPKKGEKLNKETLEKAESIVSTVVKNEINNEIENELTNIQQETENEQIWNNNHIVESNEKVIWTIWTNVVVKPKGRIAFEAQVAPVPLFKVPADIRQYLINNWFTTDVYKKDKEWLEKHNADMKMINKLKEFLTNM